MAKGVGIKGSRRRRVIQRGEDSDESDEEYKVTEDEEGDESDEYSFDVEESEELLDGFKKSRRVARSRNTRKGSSGRKRIGTTKPRKRRKILYKEDDDDDDEEEEDVAYEDDEEITSWGKKARRIKKPTEKKRVSLTEVNDEEEMADEDDAELTTFGGKTNQTKKPAKKRRASYKESDDDDDDDEYNGDSDDDGDDEEEDDYAESVSPRIKRSRRKKHDEDNDEMEDEYDEESMSLGNKASQIKKPSKKDAVSFTGLDVDDDVEEEEYTEDESSSRKRNQRNKPRENRSIVYTEDAYEDEDEYVDVDLDEVEDEDDDLDEYVDDDEDVDGSMYSGRKANRKRKLREKRGVTYTESDDEDGFGFISTTKEAKQIKEPREENTVLYKDDDQEEEEDDEKDVEFKLSESDFVDDEDDSISTQKTANQIKEPREEDAVSYKDDDQEEEDDETDVEFKLSESDFVDDEDDSPKIQKNEKVNRSHPQKKTVRGRWSKSKKSKSKNSTKSKQKSLRSGRKLGSSKENKNQVEKQSKKRKPRVRADSDSDFVSSASSHRELSISEEEREQVREAKIFGAIDNSRSSSCGNEEEPAREQRKYLLRKGKEKIEDVKDETWKQVCGICLSEEGKRTVRGVLNCCQHYFCFSCIMEWSKVESRCPLCKQRFATITKAAKSDTAFALRTVVIPVPECDQVYQPSEEELRGYLDPYENVMCTECQRGGDDALMLLCDICDSSAHTFCVGLGQEVPEGNWYCDGCRPTVFSSLNSQLPTPTSDRRLSSNVSDLSSPIAGGFDLNEAYVPETPLTQQTHVFPEPGLPVNDFLAGPIGTGATTLRDRRWIRRQIHNRFWNNNNRTSGTSPSSSGVRLFGSQLEQTVAQPHASSNRRENHNNDFISSIHDIDFFSSRADQFSVEVQNSNLASLDMSLHGENGASGMIFDSRTGYPQLHPCTNRANITTDACREVIGPSRTSQGGFHAPY